MRQDIVCGVDIGSSSIRALVLQPLDFPSKAKANLLRSIEERILGFAEGPTKGFSKGTVSNLGLLSDAIEETVSKAEKSARCRVRKVITNIAGVHIRTFKSRGSVHISERPSEITKQDLKRCIESAKRIAMSLDREVLHLAPERFYIDDKMETSDPLGLFGSKLDVDLNIITTLVSILQNIAKAVNLAGYEIENVVTSGAGTAFAIFDDRELEEGALIIDVGKDITEAAIFLGGKLKDCFYFPFGSDDFTQALQDKLKIRFEEAEDLRIKHGIVANGNLEIYDSQILLHSSKNIEIGAGGGSTAISRREISNLLVPKVEDIIRDVYKKTEFFIRQRKSQPHVRVVGGVSNMDGFIESVEEIFGVPVEIGRIRNAGDLSNNVFACCLGLARYSIRSRLERESQSWSDTDGHIGRVVSKIRSIMAEYF